MKIAGILSNEIRQHLLEHDDMTLAKTAQKARTFESAQKDSKTYLPSATNASATTDDNFEVNAVNAKAKLNELCYFCGNKRHARPKCPARDAICRNCQKQEHFAKVCLSSKNQQNNLIIASSAASDTPTLACVSSNHTIT